MDRAKLIAEIVALTAPPEPVTEDEITVSDYARVVGCGRCVAQARLDALVKADVLIRRQASINGRPGWAYRKVT